MPFVIAFIAIIMVAIGVRGHAKDAGDLLQSEFTGSNSFVSWFLAIMILGLIGYYKPVRPVADAMLGLVIVAILLTKANPNAAGGGFFAQLNDAFKTATAVPAQNVTGGTTTTTTNPATAPSGNLLGPSNTNILTGPGAAIVGLGENIGQWLQGNLLGLSPSTP